MRQSFRPNVEIRKDAAVQIGPSILVTSTARGSPEPYGHSERRYEDPKCERCGADNV